MYYKQRNVFTLKKLNDHCYRLVWNCALRRVVVEDYIVDPNDTSGLKQPPFPFSDFCACPPTKVAPADDIEVSKRRRFASSLSRSRSRVKEICLCNDFDYFVTLTFSPDKVPDRYDFDGVMKVFCEWLHNINRGRDVRIEYVIIPEHHRDGAWHLHGLLRGLLSSDLRCNANGYFEWSAFADRFGFMSLSEIRDRDRCATYITKYITKSFAENSLPDGSVELVAVPGSAIESSKHLYFCSHGLKRPEVVYQGSGDFIGEYDYQDTHGYVRVAVFESLADVLAVFCPADSSEIDDFSVNAWIYASESILGHWLDCSSEAFTHSDVCVTPFGGDVPCKFEL